MIDKANIPRRSGVYLFKDNKGRIIYVGKAIDLYHRVISYFSKSIHNVKTTNLVQEIHSLETIVVESELEALILEANLIKKYLPKFNIRLTDDKDYLYIKVTKEVYPRIITARRHELGGALKYFGPFPSSRTVRNTLKSLRRVFPWCSNVPNAKIGHRPCFYYHIGLCPGACMGKISRENYRKNIKHLIQLLDGKKERLLNDLTKEMSQVAKNQEFEKALGLKKMVDGINYLTQPQRTRAYLENPNFLEQHKQQALQALQKVLNLKQVPERIEGYDVSNIQGKEATGSMVVLTNGDIDKSQYRKFKIKTAGRVNDVAMIKEMISRRIKHTDWPKPDLVIVDGGKGQVNVACQILRDTPTFGLAKRMEWLYTPLGQIIKLKRTSPALHLLQKLRDEAHRFALAYHRKLRGKIFLE